MSEARREHRWATQSTDVVAVARALGPIVHDAGQSLRYVQSDGYYVSGVSAHFSGVKDVDDAARRLPEPVRSVSLSYSFKLTLMNIVLSRPSYRIRLEIKKGTSYIKLSPDAKVSVELQIEGPDNDSTTGLMDRLRTEFNSEIERQEPRDWSAPVLAKDALHRSVTGSTQQGSKPSFWTTSRKWIAGVLTALLVGVGGQLIYDRISGKDSAPTQPVTSPAVSTTTAIQPPTPVAPPTTTTRPPTPTT